MLACKTRDAEHRRRKSTRVTAPKRLTLNNGATHDPNQTTIMNSSAPASTGRIGYYRWHICALLFFAATINYVDRQVIGILKPTLTEAFGWNDERIYSSIVFSFQLAYAIIKPMA